MKPSKAPRLIILLMTFVVSMSIASQTVMAQAEIIFATAWSPDGSKIAIGRFSKIEILDAASGVLLKTLLGSNGAVSSVDWSPDSTKVAGASFNPNGLSVWDICSGQVIATLSINVVSVKWNPDNTRIAATSIENNVGVWNTSTGQNEIANLSGGALDWSPDGSKLVSGSYDDSTLIITNITLGEQLLVLTGNKNGVEDVDWSPDGTKIASVGSDNTVRVWNAITGSALLALTGHTDIVTSVAWNSNNVTLASGSGDETVRFWNTQTGQSLGVIQTGGVIRSISWSPDGSQLAFGGTNGTLEIVAAPIESTPTPASEGSATPISTAVTSFNSNG